jgi:hypothetical protein
VLGVINSCDNVAKIDRADSSKPWLVYFDVPTRRELLTNRELYGYHVYLLNRSIYGLTPRMTPILGLHCCLVNS